MSTTDARPQLTYGQILALVIIVGLVVIIVADMMAPPPPPYIQMPGGVVEAER